MTSHQGLDGNDGQSRREEERVEVERRAWGRETSIQFETGAGRHGTTVGQVPEADTRCRLDSRQDTSTGVAALTAEADRVIKNSMASQTWNTYKTAEKWLEKFRLQFKLSPLWPVPLEHLIHFIAYLSLEQLSPSTVRTYISGLSNWHRLTGYGDPTEHFVISKLLEGCSRGNTRLDVRSPITLPVLEKIVAALSHVCSSQFETELFATAFKLAFFAFLRVGEITSATQGDISNRAVGVHDVSLIFRLGEQLPYRVKLFIRKSKNDQRGNSYLLYLERFTNENICPVLGVYKYLKSRNKTGSPQLLTHYNGVSVTRYQFNTILKRTLQFINSKGQCYKSHSFRIGAATEAVARGVPEETIKLWGRWRSGAYNRYIRFPHK
ncbi:uncharacterized protein LOC121391847 [Gigantopelta aegis]|uniref:uncharacterized protein LOC121391847 n=1 Tax=Gigantopelta aegis TaxID=1735272 RepID=UPI001B8883E1|nr:uncharacterized protein LOC121391847 [Gigantopelta aegis]